MSKIRSFTAKLKTELQLKKSRIVFLAGKYRGMKPVREIDLDKVRDYIDYSNY